MCSEKFPKVLKNDFEVLVKFFRNCQQFSTGTFLMTKCPKSRRIWGMSRAVKRPNTYPKSFAFKLQPPPGKTYLTSIDLMSMKFEQCLLFSRHQNKLLPQYEKHFRLDMTNPAWI